MKANEKLCGVAAVMVYVGVVSCVEVMPDWMLAAVAVAGVIGIKVMAGRGHV